MFHAVDDGLGVHQLQGAFEGAFQCHNLGRAGIALKIHEFRSRGSSQNPENDNYDHELNQCKTGVLPFHGVPPASVAVFSGVPFCQCSKEHSVSVHIFSFRLPATQTECFKFDVASRYIFSILKNKENVYIAIKQRCF